MPKSQPKMAETGDGVIRDASPGESRVTSATLQAKAQRAAKRQKPPVGGGPGSPTWRDSTPGKEGAPTPEFSSLFMLGQESPHRFVIEAESGDGLPTGPGYVDCPRDGCGWVGRETYLDGHIMGWHGEGKVGELVRRRVQEKEREARKAVRKRKNRGTDVGSE